MQIHLEHPDHGKKIASIEMEAEFDEKHGWTRYNPEETQDTLPVNALETKRNYTRRVLTEGL